MGRPIGVGRTNTPCPACKDWRISTTHEEKCLKPARERRAAVKALGLCYRCKDTPSSEAHQAICLRYIRGKNLENLLIGNCTSCEAPKDSETHAKCLQVVNERRKQLSDADLCRDCQNPLTSDEHLPCLEKRRNKEGRCWKCGFLIDSNEHQECKEEQNKAARRLYQEKLVTGECVAHHGRKAVVNTRCSECWMRSLATLSVGASKNWQVLKDLWDSQGGLCAYTGVALVEGDGASVDHKTPKARGGTNTLGNVHWVLFEINKTKDMLTDEEFLIICKHNYETKDRNDSTLDKHTKNFIVVWEYQLRKGK